MHGVRRVHGACAVRAGVLLVHEVLVGEAAEAAGEAQLLVACLSLHMALYSRGRQRTAAELHALLGAAGFVKLATLPTAASFSVTVGAKPPPAGIVPLATPAVAEAEAEERAAAKRPTKRRPDTSSGPSSPPAGSGTRGCRRFEATS